MLVNILYGAVTAAIMALLVALVYATFGATKAKKQGVPSPDLKCSFCGKAQEDVRKLIAGPTVFICDACVDVCNDILAADSEYEGKVKVLDRKRDAEAISGTEQQIAKAWVSRDRATIDAILAPGWSVTDSSGQVLNKQQVLQETFDSTDRRIDTMVIDDVSVQTLGEVAVATGRTRASGSYRGAPSSVVLRFTDVFVRRVGQWQVVASHASTVVQ